MALPPSLSTTLNHNTSPTTHPHPSPSSSPKTRTQSVNNRRQTTCSGNYHPRSRVDLRTDRTEAQAQVNRDRIHHPVGIGSATKWIQTVHKRRHLTRTSHLPGYYVKKRRIYEHVLRRHQTLTFPSNPPSTFHHPSSFRIYSGDRTARANIPSVRTWSRQSRMLHTSLRHPTHSSTRYYRTQTSSPTQPHLPLHPLLQLPMVPPAASHAVQSLNSPHGMRQHLIMRTTDDVRHLPPTATDVPIIHTHTSYPSLSNSSHYHQNPVRMTISNATTVNEQMNDILF